jgi:hypothetical protein
MSLLAWSKRFSVYVVYSARFGRSLDYLKGIATEMRAEVQKHNDMLDVLADGTTVANEGMRVVSFLCVYVCVCMCVCVYVCVCGYVELVRLASTHDYPTHSFTHSHAIHLHTHTHTHIHTYTHTPAYVHTTPLSLLF